MSPIITLLLFFLSKISIRSSLDLILEKAKGLETKSSIFIQNASRRNLSLKDFGNHLDIKNKTDSIKQACRVKWMKLAEIQNEIKKTKSQTRTESQLPKTISLLIHEKALLLQQIEYFKQKSLRFNQENVQDQLSNRIKFENTLNSAIQGYRLAIRELKCQEVSLDANISDAKADLTDLISMGKALDDKILKFQATSSSAAKQAREEKLTAQLQQLTLRSDKLSNNLFKFIDKQYPPRTRQTSLDVHMYSKKISIPSLRTIVENLLSLSLEDPQKYFQLPWGKYNDKEDPKGLCAQGWAPYLKLLYDSDLIFVHPSDPSQIRLTNFHLF